MGINGFIALMFIIVILAGVFAYILTSPGGVNGFVSYFSNNVNKALNTNGNQTIVSTCESSVQLGLNHVAAALPSTVQFSIANVTIFRFGNNSAQNTNLVDSWLSEWTLIGNKTQGTVSTSYMCPTTSQLSYFCVDVGNSTAPGVGVIIKIISQKSGGTAVYRVPVLCSSRNNVSTIMPASVNYLDNSIPSLVGS
jgi:hypothetical protein